MSKRPKKCKNLYNKTSLNMKPKPPYSNIGNPQEHHAYDAGLVARMKKVFGQTMTKPRKKP